MVYLKTVKGYDLGKTIGEGSYGKVKIGRNPATGELVAVKIVPKTLDPGERQRLHKEIIIHKSLMHENVVRMYSSDEDQYFNYIVMELAGGGELFDKIAPDYGVEEDLAHFYFTQLIAGVKYLHNKGIAHRDLKPENLLLDDNGNLKISDFGFSTVFKHKGVIRHLTTPCGSPPYVAPEIHSMKYSGTAVDIWSTGVILYTLFVGNTPWEEPTMYSPEFAAYVSNPLLNFDPWNRIPINVLSLLTGILNVNPTSRFTMKDIEMHQWYRRRNPILSKDGKCVDPIGLATRLMDKLTVAGEMDIVSPTTLISFSQPQYMTKPAAFDPQELTYSAYAFSQPAPQRHVMSFSQPTQVFTQTFTQQQFTGGFSHVLPSERLTRFYSLMPIEDMLDRIAAVLEFLVVPHATHREAQKITLNTVDKRKCPLYGDVRIQRTGDGLQLIVFRRSKGDPLEWRRLFKAVTSELEDVVFMG